MHETNHIQLTIKIDDEDCTVTAIKSGKTTWKASGICRKKMVTGASARNSNEAFENWKHLAEMQEWD